MDDTTESILKPRKKYMTSFANVSQEEAEVTLRFRFTEFYNSQIPLDQFITRSAPDELKKMVFDRLVERLISEDFPEATISPLNEAVITDYVGQVLATIVAYIARMMKRRVLKLRREKQIISKDEKYGRNMEFMVIQSINVDDTRYVIIIEAKCDTFGKGLTQLLLSLRSMFEINNDQNPVYGFVTTAVNWQLVTYDGQTWKISESSVLLSGNMEKQEDRWLKNNTQILDVIYTILSSL
ncbi:unnamed protein product [Adineta ricciae]|uniref:Uncharacterized protein n=1 Tax=Adineta ricciae TaxID=249248 RepID=A0A815P2R9_ADIRI|nr:unnamed protein product [Adineta ricciae]CAF1443365.1 unnamed protein product [Adineta ricciae]